MSTIPRSLRRHLGRYPDLFAVIETAVEQGWDLEMTGNNHIRLKSPDGRTLIHTGGTPSDWRSTKNLRAQLRRAGVTFAR